MGCTPDLYCAIAGDHHFPESALSSMLLEPGAPRSWRDPYESTKSALTRGISSPLIHERFAISHHAESQRTFALLVVREHGKGEMNAESMIEHVRQAPAVLPAMLPLILLEIEVKSWYRRLMINQKKYGDVASQAGLFAFAAPGDQKPAKNTNFAGPAKKVTETAQLAGGQHNHLIVVKHLVDLVREMHLDNVAPLQQNLPVAVIAQQASEILERLDAVGEMSTRMMSRLDHLLSELQLHLQMIFSIITIRDSELSRRDSVDMRVIPAVTLIFLPATFAAVCITNTSRASIDSR